MWKNKLEIINFQNPLHTDAKGFNHQQASYECGTKQQNNGRGKRRWGRRRRSLETQLDQVEATEESNPILPKHHWSLKFH